ncbi:MAG: type II secretion system GspH family protein [Clostridioides sp.]|jgi:type II secretory pathway pseudopilin PulG|nr:type II secretion system GspH family protein [Clostridioides sp.]
MKKRRGYLLLESITTLAVICIISLAMTSLLLMSSKIQNQINDEVELQQQAAEIMRSIDELISQSYGIIQMESGEVKDDEYLKIGFIDLKYSKPGSPEDKRIYVNRDKNKLFVTNVIDGNSKGGGYEIGDYIDGLYIKGDKSQRKIGIRLKLKKKSEYYMSTMETIILNAR